MHAKDFVFADGNRRIERQVAWQGTRSFVSSEIEVGRQDVPRIDS